MYDIELNPGPPHLDWGNAESTERKRPTRRGRRTGDINKKNEKWRRRREAGKVKRNKKKGKKGRRRSSIFTRGMFKKCR